MAQPTSNKQHIIHALQKKLPKACILTTEEELRPYECDGLSAYRVLPMLVVLPETEAQVLAVVTLCRQMGVAVIARGAGTGLSGGALPLEHGVVLSLAKLNRILTMDPARGFARVQPGVRNLAISQTAAAHGLYYAPDPSSQIACSIGGNVAENSGGVHCLKYGLTVHNVLEVTIITIEGERIVLGSTCLDSAGFDLLALIHGSEGMLGIIVEIVVRLIPKPAATQVILAAFEQVEQAGRAVAEIIAQGIIPAGLEMMDALAIQAAEDYCHAGYPTDAQAVLLCEIDGMETELATHSARIEAILQSNQASLVHKSASEAEGQRLWLGRKSAFPAVGRIAPDYYCMDGTIPRQQLATVLTQISQWSQQYELPVANVFHAGDGNLHQLILYDANRAGELHKAEQFGAAILNLCVQVGGTITGEHGVGIEKIDQMCSQFADDELAQFHAIKKAFDPSGLLNPGKAVPTLHRCAELGAMHVHNGQLPHPNLPRF